MKKIILLSFLSITVSFLFQRHISVATAPVHPGKIIYEQNCLTCHQADGKGVPGMNPPLSKTEWVLGNKTRLIKIVLNGMKSPIEINGESFHNPMPSHDHLSDQQIADVLSYVRSSFGNKASDITLEEVKKTRAGK